jgi:3-dehydroquinate synthase
MSDRNLIITGFMGTGKSAVGRTVAARLQREFVDTDQLIETRTGRSIPDVFAQEGEAHFRDLEAQVCRQLSASRGMVIATGGWTLGSPDNRSAMEVGGLIVCLRADAPTLIQRVGSTQGRPMLKDAAWQSRLRNLLESRQRAYLSIPLQVDTACLSIDEVADRVLALWESFAQTETPHAMPVIIDGDGYAVLVGEGLLDRTGQLVNGLGRWTTIAQVTDDVVAPLYADRLATSLEHVSGQDNTSHPPLAHCVMPAGEVHKTLGTLAHLYPQFLAAGLDRSGLVLALGGGVVGDVAGFAAATFMRGLPVVQIPTTLLAMVDASVGGKTGVDLPAGKNLVGAFKQPALVVVDPTTLSTLPQADLRAGMAEVVKAGVIGSPELFERLEQGNSDDTSVRSMDMTWIIRQAVAVKIEAVESDPYERGRRAVLNLGHTFGHAFEVLSDYQLRHGEAVAMGMVVAARLAVALGHCPPDVARRIRSLLGQMGLSDAIPDHDPVTIWEAMMADKKKRGSRLRFVLPLGIGQVGLFDDVPREAVIAVLTEIQQSATAADW